MKYSFDTSAFINSWWKYYPPDVFPSLWQQLDGLAASGILIASDEVLAELERKDDEVHDWVSERSHIIVPLNETIQSVVLDILAEYPRLVDNRRNRSQADPFVIALAHVEECAVVTYETRSNSLDRPRIPDVCDEMGIEVMDLLGVIREQQWTL